MLDPIDVASNLDARHAVAQAAFEGRDIVAYAGIFSADLEYRQANGIIIGRDALLADVKLQFRRLSSARSEFDRESLSVDDDLVMEMLLQRATVSTKAFGLIKRTWQISRRGSYTWMKEGDVWRIIRVHVLTESINGR